MELREVTYLAVIIRLMAAVIFGGLIGLERGIKNRPAGLRTYMLVSVGACLIMLTNQYLYQVTQNGDPMRLGAQVVSGIGFLGAGTIIVTKHNQIKGLTTAAGLWASAGVGLALGIGFYEAAAAAGLCVFFILTALQRWDNRIHRRARFLELYLEISEDLRLSTLTKALRELDFVVQAVAFDRGALPQDNTRALTVALKANKREDHVVLLERISSIDGVIELEEL